MPGFQAHGVDERVAVPSRSLGIEALVAYIGRTAECRRRHGDALSKVAVKANGLVVGVSALFASRDQALAERYDWREPAG